MNKEHIRNTLEKKVINVGPKTETFFRNCLDVGYITTALLSGSSWALVYFSNRSSETLVFNYSHERIYYLTTLSLTCATSLAGMMKNNDGLIKNFDRYGDKK